MKRISLISYLIIACTGINFAQGVSVNPSGDPPDASAILDVQSSDKGVLVPRMSSAMRTSISSPATGLLVYDLSTESFWFRTASEWVELTNGFRGLHDLDEDTRIQVEESPDEDQIRFDIGGVEAMVLNQSTQGATRLDIGPGFGLIIGRNAGLTTYSGWNTFLGYSAGENNTTGDRNVFVGYRAGQNNGVNRDRNVLIGYEVGVNNDGGSNTMIGYHAGNTNTTGHSNTFLGYQAGVQNESGYRNTFIGQTAGHNNEVSNENTFVGFNAGYNNEASLNTFIGVNAGMANRTGTYNVAVGGSAAGTPLNARDLGNGNTLVGYESGFFADSIGENTLVGYRTGYALTRGMHNTLIGYQAGLLADTAIGNVAVGINALRQNRYGNYNVAVGDSALFETTVGGNVAVGTKAGLENTNGTGNTFLGNRAGANNSSGDLNTFVGWRAGSFNSTGEYNVAIGSESANANSDGDGNVLLGYAAGFRNDSGNDNVFIGIRSGEYNIDGSTNIGIGDQALNRCANGNFNIGIGNLALGDNGGGSAQFYGNIAIGLNAGKSVIGNENIIIGNESGIGINGTDNVLIGNDISHVGMQNTYLGSSTSAGVIQSPIGATAIGFGTTILQDHSVIVGDASNANVKVGVGTATPTALLHVSGDSDSTQIFRVSASGATAFRVHGNQGSAVGTADLPAFEGLLVQGNSTFRSDVVVEDELLVNTTTGANGYTVSVDGRIACEEVRVQEAGLWPDYVFERDYDLTPLADLKKFLGEQKHLPGIPSAAEVQANGFELGNMQKRMLEKIEELTLYVIELEERIQSIEKQ